MSVSEHGDCTDILKKKPELGLKLIYRHAYFEANWYVRYRICS